MTTATDTASRDVLVVDDDPAVRSIASEMLAHIGCEVTVAEHGAAALELVDEHAYEVIFLDVGMPGMTGTEVHQRIRAKRPQQPIVFITGYTQDDLTSYQNDITWVVTKPFNMLALKTTLERIG